MGTAGKDRQAAFKAKMREAGKRQLTIWADGSQEQSIKDLLTGKIPAPQFSEAEKEEKRLKLEKMEGELSQRGFELSDKAHELSMKGFELSSRECALSARENNLKEREDALVNQLVALQPTEESLQMERDLERVRVELDQREHAIMLREREVKKSEKDIARREGMIDGYNRTASNDTKARIEKLVEYFTKTQDWKSNLLRSIDDSWTAEKNLKEIANISKKTTIALKAIADLRDIYSKQGLLTEQEIKTMSEAERVLGWLRTAATQAKDRVRVITAQVTRDEKKWKEIAFAAVKKDFEKLANDKSILWLFHLNKARHNYDLKRIENMRPGDNVGIDNLIQQLKEDVKAELRYLVEKDLKAGVKADDSVANIQAAYLISEPDLAEKHAEIVQHAITCLAAARLTKAR